MKNKFATRITLLRKQNGWSQKLAASKLGISQALLSHYEKGIRECGLDFVIRAAEVFSVSCDYLLGVEDERSRSENMLFDDISDDLKNNPKLQIGRAQMLGALNLLYSITARFGNPKIQTELNNILYAQVYSVLRMFEAYDIADENSAFSLSRRVGTAHSAALSAVCSERMTARLALSEELPPLDKKTLKAMYPSSFKAVSSIIESVEMTGVKTGIKND